MSMTLHTKVVFKNKSVHETTWKEGEAVSPAKTLSQAVKDAEVIEKQPHEGAWLERRR